MEKLLTVSYDKADGGPETVDSFPIELADGDDARRKLTVALVNSGLRDHRMLEILLDAATALLANANNCDEMLATFIDQVKQNRELVERVIQSAVQPLNQINQQ